MADPIRADGINVTPADIGRLAARFDLSQLEPLGGFENLLFRSADPPGRIVRLTHTSRRSVDDVEAEVAFMRHLASHDVPVVAPVESTSGSLAEPFRLDDGSETVAYCMTEARGRIKTPSEWTDAELIALGELLGRAHVVAADFDPGDGPRRPPWTDDVFDPGTAVLGDPEFTAAWQRIREHATGHPAGGSDLLIHQDAHFWNIHVEDPARLVLFDFDDCGYGTAVHDVAIVLFYWLFVGWEDERAAARRFLDRFLEGYGRHTRLADGWEEGVDRILKVREADIYLLISLDDEDWGGPEWRWMDDRRRRVTEQIPLLGAPLVEIL